MVVEVIVVVDRVNCLTVNTANNSKEMAVVVVVLVVVVAVVLFSMVVDSKLVQTR